MTLTTTPFRFDELDLPPAAALVAEVPPGIRSTMALLEELYRRLRFPDYFGDNWDALWECIRDLSWLPPGAVVLKHHDLPLAGDVAGQRTYLSILSDTVEKKLTVPGQHLRDLIVIFPPETQQRVDWLLGTNEIDKAEK